MGRSLCLLLLMLCALPIYAAVVYTQPPSAAGGVLISSWVAPNGSDADMYAYDSFTLSTPQTITEIDWRGGYLNNATLPNGTRDPLTDFTITIYASIAGGSQPNVSTPGANGVIYLARYTGIGNAGETPAGTIAGIAMYDYKYTLATPFQAAAGTKYWVQIEATQSLYPDWGLAVGTGGDGQYYRYSTGLAMYQMAPNDTTFSILTAALHLTGDLNNDGLVNEDDADLVLQYLLGERPDLDAAVKSLAVQAGLPSTPPDIRVALWIMNHRQRTPSRATAPTRHICKGK